MSMPDLMDGDLIFTRSIKAHYFDTTGQPILQATFSSGRKRKFAFILLAAVDDGQETQINIEAAMKKQGWIRDPKA
jgi:hypothetical protein